MHLISDSKLKIQHQSIGYFSYECLKGCDCYFCEVMNRKPLTDDESFRKNGWTPNEIKYLIEKYSNQPVNITCQAINKTRGAVFTMVTNLRKETYIKSPKRIYSTNREQYKSKPNKKYIRRTDY